MRGTAAVFRDKDLLYAMGCELRCFSGFNLDEPPVMVALAAANILQVHCTYDYVVLQMTESVEILQYSAAGGFSVAARLNLGLLEALHPPHGPCHVVDARFGKRALKDRTEVIWTLSCGVAMITELNREETMIAFQPVDGIAPIRACANIGHSRRFVALSAPRLDLIDYTEPAPRTKAIYEARLEDRLICMAPHPTYPHLLAVASAQRTIMLDVRFPKVPLLSRAHIHTTFSEARVMFWVDESTLVVVSHAGLISLHRLDLGKEALMWIGDVHTMESLVWVSQLHLSGCCFDASSQRLVLTSTDGDVCFKDLCAVRVPKDQFWNLCSWRRLQQDDMLDRQESYPFKSVSKIVTTMAKGLPEPNIEHQSALAMQELMERDTTTHVSALGLDTIRQLQEMWDNATK